MNDISTVLIVGAGPVVIGQSSEFDYSCSQACLACKEYEKKVIMLNSNPATISTDKSLVDKLYFMPININSVEEILKQNKIDGIMLSFGGQTALNLVSEIKKKKFLQKYNLKILGTSINSINIAEDRSEFKKFLSKNNLPTIESKAFTRFDELEKYIKNKKFPVIMRSAFTLGGLGSGIAKNKSELLSLFQNCIKYSPINQVIVDENLLGYKEIEYEIIRDRNDTCLSICNMENIDPVGVHTGESIVVAPTQTLDGQTHHKLRDAAFTIVKKLKIIGACNVQFALSPDHSKFHIIEINPRVSRSSALASKATSYPIAKIAAYICLGHNLIDIKNPLNNKTAAFEPAFDYVVTKIPKWPFDRFNFDKNDKRRVISTQMKSTGEVMSISKNLESSLMKGFLSLNKKNPLQYGIFKDIDDEDISVVDNLRIYRILEFMRKGKSLDYIFDKTKITKFFLKKLQNIISLEKDLLHNYNDQSLKNYLNFGFTKSIINFYKRDIEINESISYNLVDMFAGEFETNSNYYYSSFREFNELKSKSKKKKVIVLGLGPTDIGNGIEFDYATTQAIWSLQKLNYEVVVLNNNPGTVSTDYNVANILCFDPVHKDYLLNLINTLDYHGVLIQYGGQPALNCAFDVAHENVNIKFLGTSIQNTLKIEDRSEFYKTLSEIKIKHPKHFVMHGLNDVGFMKEVSFPIIARPSFIIGGNGIEYIESEKEFKFYLKRLEDCQENVFPVVIDEFIKGKEIEVDAVSDGGDVFIPAVLECVESAGVHPGDSIIFYNPDNQKNLIKQIGLIIQSVCEKFNVKGVINFQFIVNDSGVYLIESNPRASRSLCLISKIVDQNLIDYGINVILGKKIKEIVKQKKDLSGLYAAKVPVFCFDKIRNITLKLNASMKSTGEVLGFGLSYEEALLKAMIAAKYNFTKEKLSVYIVNNDKEDFVILLLNKYNIDFEKLSHIPKGNSKNLIVVDLTTSSNITYSDIGTQMYFCSLEKLDAYLSALNFFRKNNVYDYTKCRFSY